MTFVELSKFCEERNSNTQVLNLIEFGNFANAVKHLSKIGAIENIEEQITDDIISLNNDPLFLLTNEKERDFMTFFYRFYKYKEALSK